MPRNPLKTGAADRDRHNWSNARFDCLCGELENERGKMRLSACLAVLVLCLASSHAASTAKLEKALENNLEATLNGEDKGRAKKSVYTSTSGNLNIQTASNQQGSALSESEAFQTVRLQGAPQIQTGQPFVQGGIQSYSLQPSAGSIQTYNLQPAPQTYSLPSLPVGRIGTQKTVPLQSSKPVQIVNYQTYQQPAQTVSIQPAQTLRVQVPQQSLQILNSPSQQGQTISFQSSASQQPVQSYSLPQQTVQTYSVQQSAKPIQVLSVQSSPQTVRPAQRPIQVLSLPQKAQTVASQPVQILNVPSQQPQTVSFQSSVSQPIQSYSLPQQTVQTYSLQSSGQTFGVQPAQKQIQVLSLPQKVETVKPIQVLSVPSSQSGQTVSIQIPQVSQSNSIETLSIQQRPVNVQSSETISIQSPSQTSQTVEVIDTQPC